MLTKSVDRANESLAKTGGELIPRLTPHPLRRTFASNLFAIGEAPACVTSQMRAQTAKSDARGLRPRDEPPRR